jgi:hypothetical protein
VLVATDDDNTLRVYDAAKGGAPLSAFDLGPALKLSANAKELDIEGATTVDDTVLWITSHAPTSKAKAAPNRYRFFGTRLDRGAKQPVVELVGDAYADLTTEMEKVPDLKPLLARQEDAPESVGAFNIESIALAEDRSLLIGLRNPIPKGKAVIVPLTNPLAVLHGARPAFDHPIMIDLGGRGVRDMTWSASMKSFIVTAGAFDAERNFAFYRWSGKRNDAPVPLTNMNPGSLGPESVTLFGNDTALVLSDDGDELETYAGMNTPTICKDLPAQFRTFRGQRWPEKTRQLR